MDAAREFRNITAEAIRPPHESITGLSGQYLAGITNIGGDRVVLLLNIPEVIKSGVEVPTAELSLAEK